MAIKVYKEEGDLLKPVELIPMQEFIDYYDPENSEFRYIREYEITDKIQEAIEHTEFMEIAEEALSRATSAKTMAEQATEDVGTAVDAAGEAITKTEELSVKVDGYDDRIAAAEVTAQTAQTKVEAVENIANDADAKANQALIKSQWSQDVISQQLSPAITNLSNDLQDTKYSLETTRENLASEMQRSINKDNEISNSIINLDSKVDSKADTGYVDSALGGKQDKLTSGQNIKTINNTSILGEGNLELTTETYNTTRRISMVYAISFFPRLLAQDLKETKDNVWYVTDNATEGLPVTEGWRKDGWVMQLHHPTFNNTCTFIWMNLYGDDSGTVWIRNVRNREVFDWQHFNFKEPGRWATWKGDLTDLNHNDEGEYNFWSDCINTPIEGCSGRVSIRSVVNGASLQIAFVNETSKLYTRDSIGGTWKEWKEIGSGGGDLPDNLVTGVNKPYKIWNGTKEEYDAISEKEQDTIYIVDGEPQPLTDAPSDGNKYARQNGEWVTVSEGGGGGIPEAPYDGQQYARQNGEWTVVTGGGQGGGDVYSSGDNTFTGQNVFNNTVEFNNNLYTHYDNIYFRDYAGNNWSWDEFVKYGKDVEYKASSNVQYTQIYENKKIEWNDESSAYVMIDAEGYSVAEYNKNDDSFEGYVLNAEQYSNLQYFSGTDSEHIYTMDIAQGYCKTFVNFLTSEISSPDRYAFTRVTKIPMNGSYTTLQDVSAGYKAYKSTGHGNNINEYMKVTFGNTFTVQYYNSAEPGCDYAMINGIGTGDSEVNFWHSFTDITTIYLMPLEWHKDGSDDQHADACWILLPKDATVEEIQHFEASVNVPDLIYFYNCTAHEYPKLQEHLEFNSNDFNVIDNGGYNTISLKNSGGGGVWVSEAESSLHMNNYGVYSAEGYFTDNAPGDNMRFHHGFVPGGITSKAPGSGIWYNALGMPYGQADIIETEYAGKDIFHFYECSGHFIFHKYVSGGEDIKLAEITNLGIKEGPDFLKDKYALKSEITPTTPNIVKFGDVLIENGIMSNFSNTNYAQFPFLMDLTDKAFEITMKITTGDNVTNQQNILDSRDGLAFAIRNSQFILAVSNNGTSWSFEAVGQTAINANTTYLVKLSWNRLVYKVEFTDDNGENWYTTINQPYAGHPYPRTMLIGKDTTGNYVFTGKIDLNKCTLAVNGQYIWDGMADAGLLTRLETDLGNIDQTGINYINSLIDAKLGPIDTALTNILGDGE